MLYCGLRRAWGTHLDGTRSLGAASRLRLEEATCIELIWVTPQSRRWDRLHDLAWSGSMEWGHGKREKEEARSSYSAVADIPCKPFWRDFVINACFIVNTRN